MGNGKLKTRKLKQSGPSESKSPIVFSMPEQVLPDSWLTDYDGLFFNDDGEFWEPPIDLDLLAKLPRQNPQHGGIVYSRANMAAGRYLGGGCSAQQMKAAFMDFITFGGVPFLKIRSGFRQVVRLFPLPAYRSRVTKDDGCVVLERENSFKRYKANDIIWVKQYDPIQQVYGCPDYLGGLQSALLNNDATLFRRKYYINGAHMGFILYTSDPNLDANVEKQLRQKIEDSKGVGNFKSLFVNIPDGKKDGIQIIPVGNFESKDEFLNVKNVSAQDVLTAHRFPPGLAGIIPSNTAGLGNPTAYDEVYFKNETKPLILEFKDAVERDPEVPKNLKLQFDLGDKNTDSNNK